MTDKLLDASAEDMEAFCKAVGELVLWAAAIDAQLTKAVIRACSLTESPMLLPIVAEMNARVKIDILKARSRHITNAAWARGIGEWADKAAKVNSYRNTVAHHQVALSDGKLVLYSPQARQLLRRIKKLKPAPAKTVDNIGEWVETAKKVYQRGQRLLEKLDRFAEELAKRQAK